MSLHVIACYKFTNRLYKSEAPFTIDNDTTRERHSLKIKEKVRAKKEVRKRFFGHKIVNLWSSLPEKVVTSTSLDSFKNRLDKLLKNPLTHSHVKDHIYIHI